MSKLPEYTTLEKAPINELPLLNGLVAIALCDAAESGVSGHSLEDYAVEANYMRLALMHRFLMQLPSIPIPVEINSVHQVVSELLSNAVRYGDGPRDSFIKYDPRGSRSMLIAGVTDRSPLWRTLSGVSGTSQEVLGIRSPLAADTDEHGRGLTEVLPSFADDVAFSYCRNIGGVATGKTVWAQISR